MLIDLHIHTDFSDGVFTPQEIAEFAIENHVQAIGFTDHFLTRKTRSLSMNDIPQYLDAIDKLQDQKADALRIYKGLEIDTVDFVLSGRELPDEAFFNQFDYLLFEYIANHSWQGIPLNYFDLIHSAIPIPFGLAHNDLSASFPDLEPDELIDKLAAWNCFIELNEAYHRPSETCPLYQHLEPYFQATRGKDVFFSLGTDLHRLPTSIGAADAYNFLKNLELESQLHPFISV